MSVITGGVGSSIQGISWSAKTRKRKVSPKNRPMGAGEARGGKLCWNGWFKRSNHFPTWWEVNQ